MQYDWSTARFSRWQEFLRRQCAQEHQPSLMLDQRRFEHCRLWLRVGAARAGAAAEVETLADELCRLSPEFKPIGSSHRRQLLNGLFVELARPV